MDLAKGVTKIRQPHTGSSNGRQPHATEEPRVPSLEICNLTMRYGETIACHQLDFAVYAGERIAIIGPNGAGKSTLFKAIVGLITPTIGRILVDGRPRSREHRLVSYVPQHEAVDWQFPANVWDVVMMSRIRHIGYFKWPNKHDRQAVQSALEKVEMWSLRKRQIGELSGGQRRRVFIARALAQEARVLLMDEPFAGVDTATEKDLFHVLDSLRSVGVGVVIATHNLGQAATHYDKVLMLNQEQIAYGRPSEIYTVENLARTFGGYVTLQEDEGQHLVFSDDACCGE
ncbi:MAG: metal ABC transporter ATP-binding protein [Chloroflexi bacterium]|nr:metal ABC transporter ATP-binding protein [Chloroflexota bacterium]